LGTHVYNSQPERWAFGPITLALAPEALEWQGLTGEGGYEIGNLSIKAGRNRDLRILDGQHRASALLMVTQRVGKLGKDLAVSVADAYEPDSE